MKTFLLSFVFLFSFASAQETIEYELDRPEFPNVPIHDLKSVQYLVELIRQNKMNFSLILSQENSPTLTVSQAVTWPISKVVLTEPTLNEEQGRNFLKAATNDKLQARVWISKEKGGLGWKNTKDYLPVTQAHKVLGSIKNGKTGFQWEDKNFISRYSFLTPGADGKNETTEVIYGDLDIEVVSSKNFEAKEIETVKKLFGSAYYIYVPDNFPRAVAAMLRKAFTGKDWNVISHAGENNYIKAEKIITLGHLGNNYLIYSK